MRTITMHVTFGTAITFDCPDNVQACTHYKQGASIAYVRILMRRSTQKRCGVFVTNYNVVT